MGIAEQGFMIFGTKCDNAVLGKKQNTTTDTVGEALVSAKNGTKTSFFVDTDNHSGSPSSICSLGDRAAAVLTTLFRFSHVSNPFQIGMYDNSVLHCLLQSLLQLLQCLLHIRRDYLTLIVPHNRGFVERLFAYWAKFIYKQQKIALFRTISCAKVAGALGLEPRAYGFGDRRSTN